MTGRGRNPEKPSNATTKATTLVPSGPNRMSEHHHQPHPPAFHTPQRGRTNRTGRCRPKLHQCLRQLSTPPAHSADAGSWTPLQGQALLRKEVIQPHLPVRLPCYDFVPIASPTFDGSLPYGLGHRLRVLPTFVT
jgi:hypothetical protein